MTCGTDHAPRLSDTERAAFDALLNGLYARLRLPDGTLPGWSAVRVSAALHAALLDAYSYHEDLCPKCDAALEEIERKYLGKAVEIEREKDGRAVR